MSETTDANGTPIAAPKSGGPNKVLVIVGIAVVVVLLGGASVWYFALRSEDKATSVDVVACEGTSTRASADGTWKVKQEENSFVGFKMEEQFASATIKKTAIGLTHDVTGTMKVAGTSIPSVDIEANTTAIKSEPPEPRRDSAITDRGLETKTFPTATFTLTKPITLAAVPKLCEEVKATATGDLELHGVTKSVDVPVTAKWAGDTISVATNGDGFPIQLADYQIDAINVASFVQIDDHGFLKLQLQFVPA